MNLIQSLFVRGAQEAGELVGVFASLAAMGPKALDPNAGPAPAAQVEVEGQGEGMEGEGDGGEQTPAAGQPLVLKAIKEINEILAAVELLRDRGVPLAGIGDPVAVGEAKNMIIKCMEQSMQDGQLILNDEDKNPRPEGVNEPNTGLPEDGGEGAGDGQGGYNDDSSSGAADGDEAGDTSGGSEGEGEEGEGDGTGDAGGDGDLGDGGDGSEGDGEGDAGDGSDSDGDEGNEEGDGDEDESDGDDDEGEEEEEEPGSNDV